MPSDYFRREMFDMKDFVSFLKCQKDYSKDQIDRIMLRTMRNPEFMDHLFPTGKDVPADGLTEEMYALLIKKRILKSICRILEDEGPRTFNRSIATWLYSVLSVAMNTQEKRWEAFRHEYEDFNPRKEVVPETKYVTNFRVGFYLNTVLISIYRFVDDHHFDTSEVNWKRFFKILFGEKNVIEAANFILLEGVHRIDDYGAEVSDTFNQLTMFALKELENAPEMLKSQMLDLYVKRISKMFANRTFDLRANLLDIDPDRFPELVKTVSHYASQIREIINGSNK